MKIQICICLFFLAKFTQANIETDLQEFFDLVPKNRIALLFGRHFLFDAKFRTAVNYLRSLDFEVLVRDHVSKSPEVQNIIKYLGRDIDLNVIPTKIRKLLYRLRPEQQYGSVRGSLSFVQEVVDLLPDEEIANLIKTKRSNNPRFEEVTSKIRNQDFKKLIYEARKSQSMAIAIDALQHNQIEVDPILEIAFKKINEWF